MIPVRVKPALVLAGLIALSGCAVGPDYQRPDAPVASGFKEAGEGWKQGNPQDAIPRGAWWSPYQDAVLDGLERQVAVSNQTLKADEAAYRQALAVTDQAGAGLFPTVSADTSVTRGAVGHKAATTYTLGGSASWDLDVWGRIRRTIESDAASAEASAADLASARLSTEALVATDYFDLRIADELKRLLTESVTAYAKSLEITRNQYHSGFAAKSDVAQAETQLKSTQSQLLAVAIQRGQYEHAIAVLIGKPPSEFAIAPVPLQETLPVTPAGIPSALLERRPDIAAAERKVASANAAIGVAIAAYYPDLTLTGSVSGSGSALSKIVESADRVWSLGPSLAETVIDWGARDAQVAQARAAYDADVATYRQTVLTGFQQVEDELVALRVLADQAKAQADAVASAREAERLVLNQYKAGTVAYSSVITAQVAALSNDETLLTIRQNRLVASVALIAALGGGWDAAADLALE